MHNRTTNRLQNNSIFFVWGTITLFLLWKFTHLSFRFGDSNSYFYQAKLLLDGVLPYRDFFLVDPPMLTVSLAVFRLIFMKHLLLLQALPVLFEAATAFLLYRLLLLWQSPLAALAPAIYLCSYTILATSEFVTGVQWVSFFSILGLYLQQRNQLVWAGFFWMAAILTKLYAVPVVAGFGVMLLWRKKLRSVWLALLGGLICLSVMLLPFVLAAPGQALNDLILHHLHRTHGLTIWQVFGHFFTNEWLLVLLAIGGLWLRKKPIVLFPTLLLFLFLLIFQDIYYTYLALLMPLLVLAVILFLGWMWEQTSLQQFAVLILLGYALFLLVAINTFQADFKEKGRFINAREIADYVRTLPAETGLYGSHEVAPLIALLSDRPIVDNLIETNPQGFSSGGQDLDAVSNTVIEKGAFLVARISDYPEYGIQETGYEGYFSKELFQQYCSRLKTFPSTSKEQDNLIVIYHCQKNN